MTLDAYQYRDPLEVLITEESRTCKGCTSEARHAFKGLGQDHMVCTRLKRHGIRCKEYFNPQETR